MDFTPMPGAADEREAVARAFRSLIEAPEPPTISVELAVADAALSALAPYRTTERATEYARGLADGVMQSEAAIVAWLRDDCPGCPYVAERGIANAIERREHAQEAGNERNHG